MTKQELLDALTEPPCEDGLDEFNKWEGDALSYFEKHERGYRAIGWCCNNGALNSKEFFHWIVKEYPHYIISRAPYHHNWTPELFEFAARRSPRNTLNYAPNSPHWTPELREWAEAQ